MSNSNVRPTIHKLVFGPLRQSFSFWLAVLFVLGAAFPLYSLWRDIGKTPALAPEGTTLLFELFLLVLGSYFYFADLAKLRSQARKETDEDKQALLCDSAWSAIRMFYFGAGGMAVCLSLTLSILHRLK